MKTRFVIQPHTLVLGRQVIEVWNENEFVGQLTAVDNGVGVRIISKHPILARINGGGGRDIHIRSSNETTPNVIEVNIEGG